MSPKNKNHGIEELKRATDEKFRLHAARPQLDDEYTELVNKFHEGPEDDIARDLLGLEVGKLDDSREKKRRSLARRILGRRPE